MPRLDLVEREAIKDAIGFMNLHFLGHGENKSLLDSINEVPSVDAVPVVHGYWISLTDCSNAGVYCSVCNKKVWKEDYAWCNRKNKLRSNYCPNCGAKMDGEYQL